MSRPILHSQFFKVHSPKRDFYRRFQNHYAWNQQVMPVYEWEGLLYVASDLNDLLEAPPTEWPSHWILVEAASSDLENLWMEFKETPENSQVSIHTNTQTGIQSLTNSISSIPDLPELPDLSEVSGSSDIVVVGDELSSLADDLEIVSDLLTPKPPAGKPEPKAQVIAPVMDDLESLMNAESDSPAEEGEKPSEDAPGSDMLEGLSMNVGPITLGKVSEGPVPEAAATTAAATSPLQKVVEPIPDIPHSVPEDTLPPVPRASLLKKSTEQAIPPVPVHRELDELTPTPPPVAPTPMEAPANAIAEAPPVPAPAATAPAAASHVGDIPNEERLLLDQLPKSYQRAFLAVKAGNSLRMVSWPRDLSAELSGKEKDFSLNTPSPFRIAMRTEKSYHGYLIQSPFLTQFFLGWNANQYPETMTVVPVRADQLVVGFVIALGSKEAEKKAVLQAVEKVATTIGEKWKKIGPQFSKAA